MWNINRQKSINWYFENNKNNFIRSRILLSLIVSLLILVNGCCGKGTDGQDGDDGSIFVTFYFSDDEITSIDTSGFFSDFAWGIYTGKDGIKAKYYFVKNNEGSFSWTTSDNQTHTENINFEPNPGEPGEEGKDGCYQPINPNPTWLDGKNGKDGEDKYMVIQLEGDTATFFDNTCPEEQCETTSTNTNEF
ncbi:hypothetical protein WDW89_04760 [Deltaproteobacteria bacterium TL4]